MQNHNKYLEMFDEFFKDIQDDISSGIYLPEISFSTSMAMTADNPVRKERGFSVYNGGFESDDNNKKQNPQLIKESLSEIIGEIITHIERLDNTINYEIESLRTRFDNIRNIANNASKARYLASQTHEVILANLIMQILEESDTGKASTYTNDETSLLNELASSKSMKLEEVLEGFDFYDNNPYKAQAEKYLARAKKKRSI